MRFTDPELELIHSALRYYAQRGGAVDRRFPNRRVRRMTRARLLADRIGELGLTVDHDGTGGGVFRDPHDLTAGVTRREEGWQPPTS